MMPRWLVLTLILVPSLLAGGVLGFIAYLSQEFNSGIKDLGVSALVGVIFFAAVAIVLALVAMVSRYFWDLAFNR